MFLYLIALLDFHNFFKGMDTSSIRIGEVSKSIGIEYRYVKEIKLLVFHREKLMPLSSLQPWKLDVNKWKRKFSSYDSPK